MARKYKNYTDEEVINYAKDVKSRAELMRKLNLKTVGGNYRTINDLIERLDIDISHWTGQLWSKGERLKEWDAYKTTPACKKHLIAKRGHKCEECLNTEWNGVGIPLELHHIDGNNRNNKFENLQLLCPNCHALTDNWRNQKR